PRTRAASWVARRSSRVGLGGCSSLPGQVPAAPPIRCWPDPWAPPGREDRWGRSGILALMVLPPRKSPWWLLVFVVTALLWTAVLLGAGYFNNGQPPPWPTVWT